MRFSVKAISRTLLQSTSFRIARSLYRLIRSFLTSSFAVGLDLRMPCPSTLMTLSVTSSMSDNWTVSRFRETSSRDLSWRYGRVGGTSGVQSPIC